MWRTPPDPDAINVLKASIAHDHTLGGDRGPQTTGAPAYAAPANLHPEGLTPPARPHFPAASVATTAAAATTEEGERPARDKGR